MHPPAVPENDTVAKRRGLYIGGSDNRMRPVPGINKRGAGGTEVAGALDTGAGSWEGGICPRSGNVNFKMTAVKISWSGFHPPGRYQRDEARVLHLCE